MLKFTFGALDFQFQLYFSAVSFFSQIRAARLWLLYARFLLIFNIRSLYRQVLTYAFVRLEKHPNPINRQTEEDARRKTIQNRLTFSLLILISHQYLPESLIGKS